MRAFKLRTLICEVRTMSFKCVIVLVLALDAITCDIQDTLNVPEDGLLECKELIAKYGPTPETHYVKTEDDYILTMYHIPGDKTKTVILSHGIFDSSSGYFIRGNRSLGIMLAEEGYDVWAINYRGNRYSRNHSTLDPNENNGFWDYSSQEQGYYDLPAFIDYVLNATGQKQVSIVAFSQGTTSMFVLGSTRPEYNDKVKIFVALAPVAYLENVRPALSIIVGLSPIIDFILPQSMQEIAGYYSMEKAMINILCTQLVIGYELCYQGGINSVSGAGSLGIERDFFKVVVGHFPAGTSRKNLIHFAQISMQKKFGQYDYGPAKNLKVYHSFTPPLYDLSKVTVKTIIVSGINDPVSTIKDVEKLRGVLPNVVGYKVAGRDDFNHLDHMWGRDTPELTYGYVLDNLRAYN